MQTSIKNEATTNEYFNAYEETKPPIIGPNICPKDVKVDPTPWIEPCDLLSADCDKKVCDNGPTNELTSAISNNTTKKKV